VKTRTKRATVYLDPDLHRALRLKAAETDRSVSEMVNEAVRLALTEDQIDLAAFEERAGEPLVRFEDVLKKLNLRVGSVSKSMSLGHVRSLSGARALCRDTKSTSRSLLSKSLKASRGATSPA